MADDHDVVITLHGEELASSQSARRPAGGSIVTESGTAADEPVIYFSLEAWAGMHGHAMSGLDREVGGFLLGLGGQDAGGTFLVIAGAVPAVAAKEARATVKFTHESWGYLDAERQRRYPGLMLVGWYHTHPGYGVFYSDYDRFVQQNFFAGPTALGVVLDPVNKELGLYQYCDRLMRRRNWRVFKTAGGSPDPAVVGELIFWLQTGDQSGNGFKI